MRRNDMNRILIIDDEVTICSLLSRYLVKHDFEAEEAYTGKRALELLETNTFDLVLCDYRLGDMNAAELLPEIRRIQPGVPVIIITGYSDSKTAVEMMRLGVYDYISKPLVPTEILQTIHKALEEEPGATARDTPVAGKPKEERSIPEPANEHDPVFGTSETFRKIMNQVELVAPTNYSVVIYGETGSGKEVIAREIQKRSKRKDKPFVAVDCGTLSKELSGSELFGHEKGAFTGALNQKIGCFEIANGGTIFLDEIANLPYDIQASLLRVVQERKMRRVGGTKDIDLDIRIIIASNEDLHQKVLEKKFREDLYHRFDEFSIAIPPLRMRREDIMMFAQHFLHITNRELGKEIPGFEPEVEQVFETYSWGGNLRELKNVVRRAALLTPDGRMIGKDALPLTITESDPVADVPPVSMREPQGINDKSLRQASHSAEYAIILNALKQVNFNKSKAAQLLNIDRKTLYNKLKAFIGTTSLDELRMREE